MNYLELLKKKNKEQAQNPNCINQKKDFLQFTQPADPQIISAFSNLDQPSGLTSEDETALITWLIEDGDSPEGIVEVLDCCRHDEIAKTFFLKIAARENTARESVARETGKSKTPTRETVSFSTAAPLPSENL